ncbi:MAG: threonylcarbamoyl-AMP synthase, partial [Acidobacteria bacterium]|nr:threonylcarbamoyl-AMP synthase [Acidobacteriota bacterium]NIM60553.1 threonylcarbamoyl-AMP synthase [Acidobacteriota bacterium]NIO59524.1 threonylcarbamoyl-AMP synthase [Acidobacteriota bacterium]NIQ30553.1 threonylcarbamoyl-AMP synthase [Acidobacteriota bacterium]NIQ85501.1 threonylcarbamoyl-AMP synthase [Acidobacteriota bacterium]
GVVGLPTETLYGLAADGSQPNAVARLNRLKVKDEQSPVLLLAADIEQVVLVSVAPPPSFTLLSRSFWPGPLTLVLPAAPGVSAQVTGGLGTVAVRVPGIALPRILAAELGHPITGVSANLHGRRPPRSAREVADAFPTGLDLLLDGGETPAGAPSTLLDLTTPRPRILRQGVVQETALRRFLPDLEASSSGSAL